MKTQQEMLSQYTTSLSGASVYEKRGKVFAKQQTGTQEVETITSDGLETVTKTKPGDYIVRNPTGENYVLSAEKFHSRYNLVKKHTNGWDQYKPIGKIRAISYSGEDTKFIAPWGSPMTLRKGDWLACPYPGPINEVYRIGVKEFEATYMPTGSWGYPKDSFY